MQTKISHHVEESCGGRTCGLPGWCSARLTDAALAMQMQEVFVQNRRLWVRLCEKDKRRDALPSHEGLPARLPRRHPPEGRALVVMQTTPRVNEAGTLVRRPSGLSYPERPTPVRGGRGVVPQEVARGSDALPGERAGMSEQCVRNSFTLVSQVLYRAP